MKTPHIEDSQHRNAPRNSSPTAVANAFFSGNGEQNCALSSSISLHRLDKVVMEKSSLRVSKRPERFAR